jgi:2-polyprenyl-6-methoxyphenol hydroxylase-like FAD-dependent oxidoreductase
MYDAIVVGARCAGSPAGMLLARKGYKVLVVDKATFPSDTISTHMVHPPAVGSLKKWGLLDRLVATGCPPVHTYSFDFGPFKISGSPATEESAVGYGPRRTVLDKLLVDAAVEAGAEVREDFSVDELTFDDGRVTGIRGRAKGGQSVMQEARVVIGADGRRSKVAETVQAEQYNEKPELLCGYYTYWSGLPMNGVFDTYIRADRGFAAIPTHDDLTLIIAGWPRAQFEQNRKDIEGNYMKSIDLAPEFAERVRSAKRETRFVGAFVPNYFRKPYGPGWALVGDAGYNKDFITAQGILDAFRDAEACTDALDQSFSGKRSYEDAMGEYQAKRDEHVLPMYEFTCQLASMEEPPPEMQQLLGAVSASQDAMDQFVRMSAGALSPAEFFVPENVGKIMAAAGAGGTPA